MVCLLLLSASLILLRSQSDGEEDSISHKQASDSGKIDPIITEARKRLEAARRRRAEPSSEAGDAAHGERWAVTQDPADSPTSTSIPAETENHNEPGKPDHVRPYATFRPGNFDCPDTPENRALAAEFDANCDFLNNEFFPLHSELREYQESLFQQLTRGRVETLSAHEYRELRRADRECSAYLRELSVQMKELHDRNMEIVNQLVASKLEYEQKYGEESNK